MWPDTSRPAGLVTLAGARLSPAPRGLSFVCQEGNGNGSVRPVGRGRCERHHRPRGSAAEAVGAPVSRAMASRYFSRVRSTTSGGSAGAGGVLSHAIDSR